MKKLFFLNLLVILLLLQNGCVHQGRGNYINESSQQVYNLLANDSVEAIKAIRPPAKTTFLIKQKGDNDLFGVALIDTLKRSGFAIAGASQASTSGASIKTTNLSSTTLTYAIDYVDDLSGGESSAIRVTFNIGGESLSRAYSRSGNNIEPIGNWSYGRWMNG